MWRLAHTPNTTRNMHPLNYGWTEISGHYSLLWYEGASLPETLITTGDDGQELVLDKVLDSPSCLEVDPHNSETDEESLSDDIQWSKSESDSDEEYK